MFLNKCFYKYIYKYKSFYIYIYIFFFLFHLIFSIGLFLLFLACIQFHIVIFFHFNNYIFILFFGKSKNIFLNIILNTNFKLNLYHFFILFQILLQFLFFEMFLKGDFLNFIPTIQTLIVIIIISFLLIINFLIINFLFGIIILHFKFLIVGILNSFIILFFKN